MELKPCPFCGGDNIIVITTFSGVKISCIVCGAKVGSSKDNGEYTTLNRARKYHLKAAIKAWNRRVSE